MFDSNDLARKNLIRRLTRSETITVIGPETTDPDNTSNSCLMCSYSEVRSNRNVVRSNLNLRVSINP